MEMATSKRNINGTTRMERKIANRKQISRDKSKKNKQAIQGCHSKLSNMHCSNICKH